MITYLLDVSLCWLIFYLLYYFWLSKETFFHLNRWYLLATLLLGILIPLLPSPFGAKVQESEWITLYVAPITTSLEALEITVTAPGAATRSFDWLQLFRWIYWVGVVITAFRFLSGLWRIGTLYWRAEHIRVGQYKVALTNEPHLPFSFFRVVFKSKLGNLDEFAEEKITDHELAHVRGWHTIDVLMVELASIFLWCSPPVYLYRRSLRIVHEYIADSAAIRSGQKKKYGHLLIRQSQSGLQLALANHFIQSQLKKRIMMMTKTRSRRQAFLKYLPVIPLLVLALVVFSNWEAVASDPLNLLKADAVEGVEVMKTAVPEDFDPKVLRKQLSAILHKRRQVETDQDATLAKGFVALHDEWTKKYPDHQQEIRQIAEEVATNYDLNITFAGKKITNAFFVKPFAEIRKESRSEIMVKGSAEGEIKIGSSGEGEPYVLIDDKPAGDDWKSQLKPEEIESIDVLKGEAAIDAFGEIAKDGAIRIYTKGFKKTETIMPRFPGCEHLADPEQRRRCSEEKLMNYLYENLRYPSLYYVHGVQGTEVVTYTVDKLGGIREIHIIRSIGSGFDQQVRKALENMPKQVPGTIDGKPADIKVTLPIKFKATDKEIVETPNTPNAKVIISELENGKKDPLYIVDGEILESGNIKEINPNDIEKIDVLKGESAIEAYGERGANGVVRIFTKQLVYDVSPVFPGCEDLEGEEQVRCSEKSFLVSVYKNIKYPATARENHIDGTVIVQYTISASGRVENPHIVRGLDRALDQEVLRVINEIPDWKPALKDGKAVAVEMVLPVRFKIENDEDSERAKRAVLEGALQKERNVLQKRSVREVQTQDEVVVVGYGRTRTKRDAFKTVEEMPRFPGCEGESEEIKANCSQQKMLEFVYNNLRYPKAARDAGVSGTVLASFIVGKDGNIRDIQIEKGRGYGLNEQVEEVINKMPAWIPGKQEGRAVDAIMYLPVKFQLDKAAEKPAQSQVDLPKSSPAGNTLDLQNFKAAPNPTNGLVNLRFQSAARPVEVRILSANGQTVYERELPQFNGNFNEQIDLQDAPKGTLYISVRQGEKVHTSSIIVQ